MHPNQNPPWTNGGGLKNLIYQSPLHLQKLIRCQTYLQTISKNMQNEMYAVSLNRAVFTRSLNYRMGLAVMEEDMTLIMDKCINLNNLHVIQIKFLSQE